MKPQITRIFLLIILLVVSASAQSPTPQKRKKIKDFGSSLKRLKWDPQKNAAVVLPATEDDDVIRIETSLVSCDLLVLDQKGNVVPGLTAADFSINEDDTPQTVGHFFTGDNVNIPRTIVLIFDYSGSQLPFLKNSVSAAKVLVDKLGPNDVMAIVTDDVELFQDFTTDKKKLKGKLDQLERRTKSDVSSLGYVLNARFGRSKQYSALWATLNEAFKAEDVRPIVIFQTDGDEAYDLRNSTVKMTIPEGMEGDALQAAKATISMRQKHSEGQQTQFSFDDLFRAIEKSHTTIYTVVPGIKLLGLSRESQLTKMLAARQQLRDEMQKKLSPERRALLQERFHKEDEKNEVMSANWQIENTAKLQSALSVVTGLSGGWTEFLETPEQADAIYSRIFTDINQRYIVGYYPTNKARDGQRRKIDFQVKGHPEYQVYGRRSYFAPGP